MASEGYEVTARPPPSITASSHSSVPPGAKPRVTSPPPSSQLSLTSGAGRPRSAPPTSSRPPSRTNNGSAGVRKGSGGGSGSGSKQTAKRRAMERAMTPEQRAARKKRSIAGGITTTLVLGGCAFAIWYWALGAPKTGDEFKAGFGNAVNSTKGKISALGDVLDNLDGFDWGSFFQNDPYGGNSSTTLWQEKYIERDGGGLHITIVNVLDDTWQKEFEVAIADWNESPALTITTQQDDPDDQCTRREGVMVVCNANFGETGWVGINENEIVGNRIRSSVAKMNEYYLRNANFYHRRFTMCHEVGHGFGLPHTDENPYNKNLGNCLDYTDDPQENLLPGEINFDKLQEMYLSQKRLLRRVENDDGSVIETIAWQIHVDQAEAWGLK